MATVAINAAVFSPRLRSQWSLTPYASLSTPILTLLFPPLLTRHFENSDRFIVVVFFRCQIITLIAQFFHSWISHIFLYFPSLSIAHTPSLSTSLSLPQFVHIYRDKTWSLSIDLSIVDFSLSRFFSHLSI